MNSCAIVPAFNEADRVDATVRSLLEHVVDRVLVIDDGSTDETAVFAERAGAEVARLPANRGKGAAVREGLARVTRDKTVDYVLLVDADLGSSAAALAPLLEVVHADEADLTIASFSQAGGFGVARRVAARGIRWLTGFDARSPLSGQRALSRRAVAAILPLPSGWGLEVTMTVQALWNGLRVREVPLSLEHRATGRDAAGFIHRGRQCMAVTWTLCRLTCRRCFGKRGAPCREPSS